MGSKCGNFPQSKIYSSSLVSEWTWFSVLLKKNQCDKNGHNVNGQFYKNSFGSELPLLCTLQQSLDYDTSENTLYFKEQKSYSAEVRTDSAVWLRIIVWIILSQKVSIPPFLMVCWKFQWSYILFLKVLTSNLPSPTLLTLENPLTGFIYMTHRKLGKSWSLIISFLGRRKSWNFIFSHGKWWNIDE